MSNTFALRANRVVRPVETKPADPTWQAIDVNTLPEDIRGHYYAYRQALDQANKLRVLFEEEANEAFDVGATNKLAFGYKFGKLSAAIVPKARPSASRGATNLASLAKLR